MSRRFLAHKSTVCLIGVTFGWIAACVIYLMTGWSPYIIMIATYALMVTSIGATADFIRDRQRR